MIKTNILSAGLLAAAAVALLAPSAAHAQGTVTYTPGDLLLGFEEPGYANNYIVDLGPVTEFITLSETPGTTDLTTFLSLGNIAADLSGTNAFGSGWATNSTTQGDNLQWGAFATSSNLSGGNSGTGGVLGLPKDTLFLTQAENTPGTQSSAPAEKSQTNQGAEVTAFQSFATAGFAGNAQTPNSAVATIVQASGGNSWSSFSPSTNAFGVGYGIEQPQGSGITAIGPTNSELDLYELLPKNATGYTGSGDFLGSLTLDSSGNLDFTSAAAVPEPSTYAAIGLGAAFLLMFRRNRKQLQS